MSVPQSEAEFASYINRLPSGIRQDLMQFLRMSAKKGATAHDLSTSVHLSRLYASPTEKKTQS